MSSEKELGVPGRAESAEMNGADVPVAGGGVRNHGTHGAGATNLGAGEDPAGEAMREERGAVGGAAAGLGQRESLRALVELVESCTAREQEIERAHEAAQKRAQRDFNKAIAALDERVAESQSGRLAHRNTVQKEIQQKHAAALASLKEGYEAAIRQLHLKFDPAVAKLKKEYEQARWMAETMQENAQNRVREEHKKLKQTVGAQREKVGELRNKSAALLYRYGQKPEEFGPTAEVKLSDPAEAGAVYERSELAIVAGLEKLERLALPGLFVGIWPVVIGVLVCLLAAAAGQFYTAGISAEQFVPQWPAIGVAVGAAVVVLVGLGVVLKIVAARQVRRTYRPLKEALDTAEAALTQRLSHETQRQQGELARANEHCKKEIEAAKNRFGPRITQTNEMHEEALKQEKERFASQNGQLEAQRDAQLAALKEQLDASQAAQGDTDAAQRREAQQQRDAALHEADGQLEEAMKQLGAHWTQGLERIQTPMTSGAGVMRSPVSWKDPAWKQWVPPQQFPTTVRFGQLQVDLAQLTDQAPKRLELPSRFSVPALLSFSRQGSMLIQADHAGHDAAIGALRMVMTRILTSIPAGRARFTLIDPVALGQNFAGFMHLVDYDEALVGGRIWTESDHIEQQLTNLTEHMETVIQKYLRNEFATIDDYNEQAGELAEPYRFLVIADFPHAFEQDAYRRLASICSSGARCGVYTLVVRDLRLAIPSGVHLDELEQNSVNLIYKEGRFVWKDEVFEQFPLVVDEAPDEEVLTELMRKVGEGAKVAKRVEVPFSSIAPKPEEFWTGDATRELAVPIGRSGATRQQALRLGRGVAQHALIAGKTGSGKSTLLHALVTNLAMWYSPDEVEFYLVDFKKGVEFKTYATHMLPHARAIAVESDREFGLSVLQRIDGELTRRGDLFRRLGVQDLAGYRAAAKKGDGSMVKLPRTLLIVDEFQEFFSEDDKLAQDAGLLLDRLVRQGRAFGIHVLLGSQTIGGTGGLARTTISQMAVRIALQTSEADSQLILGDNNSAARLLSRPGEAIYNDAGGLVEGNSPFQVAWLPDAQRDAYLDQVLERAKDWPPRHEPAAVFEGNAPAELVKNRKLAELLGAPKWPDGVVSAPLAWVGEPVAIKDPTSVVFRRQSGANVLLIGQQEEQAMAIMLTAILSLAVQLRPDQATFWVLDGTASDSPLAGRLGKLVGTLPQRSHVIEYRDAGRAVDELARELEVRQTAELPPNDSHFVFIYAMQRYRVLRKTEESFSFAMSDDAPKGPATDKQFGDLLREGPSLGIHIVAWSDTAAGVDRTLDRTAMREFDNRILFQMSASDSSTLIDSPAANKLGFYRALAYSEEQGTIERFRPYALMSEKEIEALAGGVKKGRSMKDEG